MSVFYFLLLIGVLVLIHELGHFVAAKVLDIKVMRFSIGYGRALFRRKLGETEYQIALLPIGGYCRIMGVAADSPDPRDARRAFANRPLWQRLMVVFAGPAANLMLPILIYFIFFAGQTTLPAAVIGDVLDGAAERAGIAPGDRILEIDGESVRYWEDIENIVQRSPGRELHVRFSRNGKVFERYITPLEDTVRKRDGTLRVVGRIGITHSPFVPIIGVLDPQSPAAIANLHTGDLLISIDGKPVRNWTDVDHALGRNPHQTFMVFFRGLEIPGAPQIRLLTPLDAKVVPTVLLDSKLKSSLYTGIERAEMIVAHVDPGSPADSAGLRVGDLIVALDDKPVVHWTDLDQRLQTEPDKTFKLSWKRWQNGKLDVVWADVTQVRRNLKDDYDHTVTRLVFGASNDIDRGTGATVKIDSRVSYALSRALERTGETIRTMVSGFFNVLGGDRPSDALGGPLMMYRVASVSGSQGWDSFLLMMALISVNLGLINLLPIPALDGGNLLVFAIEAFRRKPLTTRGRDRIQLGGLIFIGLVTVLAVRNDLLRLLWK
jgi:regulator of sigma E protease